MSESVTNCGVDLSESIILSSVFRSPMALRLEFKFDGARSAGRDWAGAGSARYGKLSAIGGHRAHVQRRGPVFVSVTVFASLVLPTIVGAKVSKIGVTCTPTPGEFVLSTSGFRMFCVDRSRWLRRPGCLFSFGRAPVARGLC